MQGRERGHESAFCVDELDVFVGFACFDFGDHDWDCTDILEGDLPESKGREAKREEKQWGAFLGGKLVQWEKLKFAIPRVHLIEFCKYTKVNVVGRELQRFLEGDIWCKKER